MEIAVMAAQVRGIRSIELELANPARAAKFFCEIWHLREVWREQDSIFLRASGRCHHVLAIHRASADPAVRRIVYDTSDRTTVDRLHDGVRRFATLCQTPHEITTPGGGYGFGFVDPDGWNFAVVCDAHDRSDADPMPDRPSKISHVNLNTPDVEKATGFLSQALGFSVIDETDALVFFRCDNSDHSSMVLSKTPRATLNHVAFEMPDIDSVMRGAGRMQSQGYPIEWGIGRHGPSGNVFAYFAGPEEFPLEYTSEVRQVDDNYTPHEADFWRRPPGRTDEWGITGPHSARWKRIQDLYSFVPGAYEI